MLGIGLTSSSPQRQLDTHRRALSRLAFPFHLRADFPGSFADADAAEVAGLGLEMGRRCDREAMRRGGSLNKEPFGGTNENEEVAIEISEVTIEIDEVTQAHVRTTWAFVSTTWA